MTRTRRSLHLVDVENLAGGPAHVGDFPAAVRRYQAVADYGASDLLIVAADIALWRQTIFDLPDGQYLPGRGPDGADTALLRAAPPEWIVRRFDRLIIGSGDHIFASLARTVRAFGVDVTVAVSQWRTLSRELRLTADRVLLLGELGEQLALPVG